MSRRVLELAGGWLLAALLLLVFGWLAARALDVTYRQRELEAQRVCAAAAANGQWLAGCPRPVFEPGRLEHVK